VRGALSSRMKYIKQIVTKIKKVAPATEKKAAAVG
jgi:hypothetical protein